MSRQRHATYEPGTQSSVARRAGFRVTEWVLGIVGAIAAFVGAFILLGSEEQYVGLGGDVSWAVGEIDPAWGWGPILVGGVFISIGVALAWRDRRAETGIETTRTDWADVLVHTVVFLGVNAFLWVQDIAMGDGLNYAYWVTIPWGIGLVAHAVATHNDQQRGVPAGR